MDDRDDGEGWPWFLKIVILLAVLVVLFLVVVDLPEFATALG
jgi:hypothetical protein